jgi:biotin-dependent carboxylase-like uncharacterized protein
MDYHSYRMANLLVGNHPGAACLEATMTGPEIHFNVPCTIAITGADMDPLLNGQPVRLWESIGISEDDRLSFAGLKSGCRTYIAVSGGIDVPVVLGSRSTCLPARTGGMEGRALRQGDELPLGKGKAFRNHPRFINEEDRLPLLTNPTVRIIPGPEVRLFGFEGIRNLLTTVYTVSQHSNRMGLRLTGPAIPVKNGTADIISAGISPGTIQVSGDGQPIVLMADRQTTGGYPRIAHVVSVDLPWVAQVKPGDTIRFREISLEKAQALIREQEERMAFLA